MTLALENGTRRPIPGVSNMVVVRRIRAPAFQRNYRPGAGFDGIGSKALIALRKSLLFILVMMAEASMRCTMADKSGSRVDYQVVVCPAEIVQKSRYGITNKAKFRY